MEEADVRAFCCPCNGGKEGGREGGDGSPDPLDFLFVASRELEQQQQQPTPSSLGTWLLSQCLAADIPCTPSGELVYCCAAHLQEQQQRRRDGKEGGREGGKEGGGKWEGI